MVALANTQVSPRAAAITGVKLLYPHIAGNPVIYKTCTQHHKDRPGVFGDWAGATGWAMHPVKGTNAGFFDLDDPDLIAAFLADFPECHEGYIQWRGDHAAFGILHAVKVANLSAHDEGDHEIYSWRTTGLYQVGSGSAHYRETAPKSKVWVASGDLYLGNGKYWALFDEKRSADFVQWMEDYRPKPPRTPAAARSYPLIDTPGDDQGRALENLYRIDPSCTRQEWVWAGKAIKAVFGDAGFVHFDAWSQGSADKYNAREMDTVWRSFKGSGITARTLTMLANKYDPAGKRKIGSVLPAVQTAPTVADQQPAPATASAAQLPASFERAIMFGWKNAGPAIATLYRAALETSPDEYRTIQDTADASGIASNKLWRAMERYSGKCLFETKLQFDPELSYPLPHDQSAIKSPLPGKPSNLYRPKPIAEIRSILLDVIGDRIAEKYNITERRWLRALDADADPTLADDINANILAGLSATERKARQRDYDEAAKEYRQWAKDLADETPAPLPHTWKSDYRAAIVERAVKPALGSAQPLRDVARSTALSIATIRRTEQRLNITRDEQYHPEVETVTSASALPAPQYNFDKKGFPALATTDNGKTYNLRSPHARRALETALEAGKVKTAQIAYQQASIPREMTADEIQARAERKAQRQDKRIIDPDTGEILTPVGTKTHPQPRTAPHVGPGFDPDQALRLLHYGETVCKHTNDPALSTRERLYRLAGRMYNHDKTEDRAVIHAAAQPDHPATSAEPEPEQTWITIERGGYIDDETKMLHSRDTIQRIQGAIWLPREKTEARKPEGVMF